jgi:hypothetical protein
VCVPVLSAVEGQTVLSLLWSNIALIPYHVKFILHRLNEFPQVLFLHDVELFDVVVEDFEGACVVFFWNISDGHLEVVNSGGT